MTKLSRLRYPVKVPVWLQHSGLIYAPLNSVELMILSHGEFTDAQQQVAVTQEYYKHVCVFIQHRPGHLSVCWGGTVKPACTSLMITQKQD